VSDGSTDLQGLSRQIHEMLVLGVLRSEEKHGYQIALDVEARSSGLFGLQHGTLYPILHRLEDRGWIKGRWDTGEGRRKKVYRLTADGRRHLSGEIDRFEAVARGLLDVVRGHRHAAL
jgi:PadR family transcriptional regulator, regulatory protein PadR